MPHFFHLFCLDSFYFIEITRNKSILRLCEVFASTYFTASKIHNPQEDENRRCVYNVRCTCVVTVRLISITTVRHSLIYNILILLLSWTQFEFCHMDSSAATILKCKCHINIWIALGIKENCAQMKMCHPIILTGQQNSILFSTIFIYCYFKYKKKLLQPPIVVYYIRLTLKENKM